MAEWPTRTTSSPTVLASGIDTIVVPGTTYEVVVGMPHLEELYGSDMPSPALVTAIAAWVAAELKMPPPDLPRIEYAAPDMMAILQHRKISAGHRPDNHTLAVAATNPALDVVAVYNDNLHTIYLPYGWTGSKPAELSILVHEMVHHLQNLAGQKFSCMSEREKDAYAVQERWLDMFGRSLLRDFEIDPLTLLVITNCGY